MRNSMLFTLNSQRKLTKLLRNDYVFNKQIKSAKKENPKANSFRNSVFYLNGFLNQVKLELDSDTASCQRMVHSLVKSFKLSHND